MHPESLTGSSEAGDTAVTAVVNPNIELLDTTYRLSPEQAIFFKGQTGIDNDDDLKTHILRVQEEAYKIYPYPCVKVLSFLWAGITTQPEYERIIKLGQERPDGMLLDIGCGFGVDARQAVADGFPLKNVVTTDLKKEFYDMAHALFNTTPETYPINFVPGDAFDPNMLQIVPPFGKPPSIKRPDLTTLTSLNPLAGRCAVIHAANLFHLFSEERQLHLAKALAGLLSPQPGSMICGEHAGNLKEGVYHRAFGGLEYDMFQHSPESWSAIWDGGVFAKGSVKVAVKLSRWEEMPMHPALRLLWSVVRL